MTTINKTKRQLETELKYLKKDLEYLKKCNETFTTPKQKARELIDKTIQDIITESQKKRHDNHVNAGKEIKKKWINQGRSDMKKEILEEINKLFANNHWIIETDEDKMYLFNIITKEIDKLENGN